MACEALKCLLIVWVCVKLKPHQKKVKKVGKKLLDLWDEDCHSCSSMNFNDLMCNFLPIKKANGTLCTTHPIQNFAAFQREKKFFMLRILCQSQEIVETGK